MRFSEFTAKSYPEKSVFDRSQFDFFTNLVKWFAMPFAYVLFRIGVSANLLDVVAILLSMIGFCLLAMTGKASFVWLVLGVLLVYFHVFVDFADGAIARAQGKSGVVGAAFDNLGTDVDRIALLLVFGILTESPYWIVVNTFASFILTVFLAQTSRAVRPGGLPRLYSGRISPANCRFMLALLPLSLVIVVLAGWQVQTFATVVSGFYAGLALLWLLVCLPTSNVGSSGIE